MRQGRIDQAVAEYAAVVDEHPADLSSLNTLGDLLVRAGKSPEALPLYVRVGDAHFREGFFSKAAGFYRKVLKFAPADEATACRLAEALAAQGLLVEAKAQFTSLLQARRRRGDAAGADELLLRIAEVDPKDAAARLDAARILVRTGDARGLEWLETVVEQLRASGRDAEALVVLQEVVAADPANVARRATLVRALLDSGQFDAVRPLLSPDLVGEHRPLLQQVAELELRAGTLEAARAALGRWLAADPDAGAEVTQFPGRLPGLDAERRFLGVDVAVDAALAEGDFALAAGMLRDFVAANPGAVSALLRLIDVCIDGGLDAWVGPAQAQLAEAYLEGGALREARLVAEDLVLRDPADGAHRTLLEHILGALGEPDPATAVDALLALGVGDAAEGDEVSAPPAAPAYEPPPAGVEEPPGPADADGPSGFAQDGAPGLAPASATDAPDLREPDRTDACATDASVEPPIQDVFDGLRARAAATRGVDGRQQLALGRTYLAAGLVDQAMSAFARAAHDVDVRASACTALGELFEEQQDYGHAIEWYERGADATHGGEGERLEAMRRLARVLESANESARALAVWLEIQTLHPEDPEAPVRVARLSESGAGR